MTDWSTIPLRGFRKWMVRGDYLTGVTYQLRWEAGTNESVCGRNVDVPGGYKPDGTEWTWDDVVLQPSPMGHTLASCQCGFHAVYPQSRFDDYWGFIEGMVEGWGQVITGPLGFRASKSKVVALMFNTYIPQQPWEQPALDHDAIAARYNVPVFDTREEMLEAFPANQGEYPQQEQRQPSITARRGGIRYTTTNTTNRPSVLGSGRIATGPTGRNYILGCGCLDCQRASR